MNKKPHTRPGLLAQIEAERKRQPRIAEHPESTESQRPVWLLRRMEMEGAWRWDGATRAHMMKLWARLKELELLTWREIGTQRHNHAMPHDKVCADARKRLEALGLDDAADVLYQLHVGQTERLWGIRKGREFLALWWDPDHTVYPMDPADN